MLDGIGVCDYIYVVDLVKVYVVVLYVLVEGLDCELILNFGIGCGYFVFELIDMFFVVVGCLIFYQWQGCCVGDIGQCWVDFLLVNKVLNWWVEKLFVDICVDVWCWQQVIFIVKI